MTESKSESTQAAKPTVPANKPAASQTGAPAQAKKTPAAPSRKKRTGWVAALVVVVLLAAALAAALWYQHKQYKATTASLTSQVQASVEAADQASAQANHALSAPPRQPHAR